MKITAKQAHVLDNLHRITMRRVGGRLEPFLDGQACKIQLNSLGAKGLIAFDRFGRPTKLDRPADLLVIGYRRGEVSRDRSQPQAPTTAETTEGDSPPTS